MDSECNIWGSRRATVRLVLLVVALVAIAYGILGGELKVVFAKGIRVCLECIGIG